MRRILTPLFFASFSVHAADYYIDYEDGRNSNNGVSQSTPYKTIEPIYWKLDELNPGDKILFKRGVSYRMVDNYNLNIASSGTLENPISISAYGSGDKPHITDKMDVVNLDWISDGTDRWYVPMKRDPRRLWLDGIEVLSSDGPGDLNQLDEDFPFYYDGTAKHLYIHSIDNPSIQYREILVAKHQNIIKLTGDYIVVDGISVDGSYDGAIRLQGASYNEIKHCHIGNGYMGVRMFFESTTRKNDHNIIRDNVFDSKFSATYKSFEYHHIGDGIQLLDGSYNKIFNNQFLNWAHDSINISSARLDGNGASYNEIYDNFFTAQDISYGRALDLHGSKDKVVGNAFYNNTVVDMPVRSQVGGNGTLIYNNIFEPKRNNTSRDFGIGEAIKIFSSTNHPDPEAKGINIYHNLFINSAEAAISMENDTDSNFYKKDISIVNNIFVNAGHDTYRSNDSDIAIQIDSGNNQGYFSNITIANNVIYNEKSSKTISYRNQGNLSVTDFESNTIYMDTARDNYTASPLLFSDYSLKYDTSSSAIAWNSSKSDPVPFTRGYGAKKYSLPRETGGWMDRGPTESKPVNTLYAAWSFDTATGNDINDVARSSSIALTLKNGASITQNGGGKYQEGITLDGVDQYLHASNSSELELSTSDLSISMWTKVDGTGKSGLGAIVAKGAASPSQEGYVLYYSYDEGRLYFSMSDGVNRKYPKTNDDITSILEDGEWHHIAVTVDRDNIVQIYVDGSPMPMSRGDISDFASNDISNPEIDFSVGVNPGTSNYFKGSIDELRLDATLLSPAFIRAVATRGN